MYQEFSQVYDELMKEINYSEWTDYLKRIFYNSKNEINEVLEFGCGSGNITLKLAESGYQMTAIDISEDMLTVADEKANQKGINNISFYLGDMTNFMLDYQYDAVIACCDTVNYLKDMDEIQSFLICSRDCLKEEGLLMFDINTSTKYKKVIKDNTFIYNLDDVYCVWENEPDSDNNCVHFNLTFFAKNSDGTYNRYEENQTQYYFSLEDIHHCLLNLGYKNIKYFNFGTFLQGSNDADRVQIVAEKK
ncbi:class I SAM-dependent methyltransferase [Eubacteriaceae bacterium ES3]|nr:class I SAM-dependent methyltransferase [Eubacteriaceae bacterium ES3]